MFGTDANNFELLGPIVEALPKSAPPGRSVLNLIRRNRGSGAGFRRAIAREQREAEARAALYAEHGR